MKFRDDLSGTEMFLQSGSRIVSLVISTALPLLLVSHINSSFSDPDVTLEELSSSQLTQIGFERGPLPQKTIPHLSQVQE
jgi:hypothetical protein